MLPGIVYCILLDHSTILRFYDSTIRRFEQPNGYSKMSSIDSSLHMTEMTEMTQTTEFGAEQCMNDLNGVLPPAPASASDLPVVWSGSDVLYFPPSGFGFWYYLGQYSQYLKRMRQSHIQPTTRCVGGSSGSLLCLCTQLREPYKDDLFSFLIELAKDSVVESTDLLMGVPNLSRIIDSFVWKLIPYTAFNETFADSAITERLFAEQRIVLTKVILGKDLHPPVRWIPFLGFQQVITTPKSLEDFVSKIQASSYIPFFSNPWGKLYCPIDGDRYIDGGIADLYGDSPVFTYRHPIASISLPSYDYVRSLYQKGETDQLSIVRTHFPEAAGAADPVIYNAFDVFRFGDRLGDLFGDRIGDQLLVALIAIGVLTMFPLVRHIRSCRPRDHRPLHTDSVLSTKTTNRWRAVANATS